MKNHRQIGLLLAIPLMALVACNTRTIGGDNNNENQNQNQNENQNENQNQNNTSLQILLTVYGSTGDVVQTRIVAGMGPVTIAPPADEPNPPLTDYVVMAQADNYYTRLLSCGWGHEIDVQLDSVPDLPQAIAGVVIRTSYFAQPVYHADGLLLAEAPDASLTTTTDAQGRFQFTDGALGTWQLEVQCNEWEYPLPSNFEILNTAETDYRDLFVMVDMSADAPNLYLYPEETTTVTVDLGFPMGGEVTLSEPPYEDGWTVSVDPDGTIEGEFPYLFYEARLPHHVQRERGWLLAADDLEYGFSDLLAQYGYMGREITDFLDFWLPLMTDSPWYAIYPMAADELVTLSIDPAPERLRRLWLFMEPLTAPMTIDPPDLPPPLSRDGFTAVEWGAFLGR
jgi:hypothetical protein